jgi:hydrogenase nickel incorporation protein HypB
MCESCGCSEPDGGYKIFRPGETEVSNELKSHDHGHGHNHHTHGHGQEHAHGHAHPHNYAHSHENQESHFISIEQDILGANNLMAERNRGYFEAKRIFAINLVSSPGSGKTSLLEKTIRELTGKKLCYVIEGDQQTDNDAKRIAATDADVLQINTGNACHLDSNMVHDALTKLKPDDRSLVFIENVGNLVCPALFDLGEKARAVIFSVTEGEDKPLKYPNMFHTSDVCIISKIDLLPHLDFNLELAKQNVLQIKPEMKIIELSVKTSQGLGNWIEWLENNN